MGKKGKKYPAHQIARKKILDDQKSPTPPLKSYMVGPLLVCDISFVNFRRFFVYFRTINRLYFVQPIRLKNGWTQYSNFAQDKTRLETTFCIRKIENEGLFLYRFQRQCSICCQTLSEDYWNQSTEAERTENSSKGRGFTDSL